MEINQYGALMDTRHFEDIVSLERVLIGAIIKSTNKRDEVLQRVKEDNFYDHNLASIFKTCLEYYIDGTPIDEHTISSKLSKRDKKILETCLGIEFTESGIGHIISTVLDNSRLRHIHSFSEKIKMMSIDPNYDSNKILGSMHSGLMDLMAGHSEQEIVTPGDIVDDLISDLSKPDSKNKTIFTYLNSLDEVFMIDEGMLVLIAARPSFGKSQLALQICLENALRDIPVLFISLEMTKKDVMYRLLSNLCEIDLFKIRKKLLSNKELKRINENIPKLKNMPLFFESVGSTSAGDIKAKARRISLKTKGKLGLVTVDYLQLMTSETEGTRNLEIEGIAKGLKSLAMDLSIPIVCLSQLNRGVDGREDKRPILSDLRDSGSLEQSSDAVIFMYKEAAYSRRKEDDDKLELIIAKQRNGPTGVIPVTNCTKFQKILDKENESESNQS